MLYLYSLAKTTGEWYMLVCDEEDKTKRLFVTSCTAGLDRPDWENAYLDEIVKDLGPDLGHLKRVMGSYDWSDF